MNSSSTSSIDLTFTTNAPGMKSGQLVTFDINGNAIFKSKLSIFGNKQFLVDTVSGNPLLTMKSKFQSAHGRWQVFRGPSLYDKDLLFSIKQSSILQLRNEYYVFFANNKEEDACDFMIRGTYHKKSCTVYKGDSPVVVAQMSKEHKTKLGKNSFGVTINPGIAVSFVAAIVVILHEIEQESYLTGAAVAGGIIAAS